ncbi:MAG TPA: ABC transporter permease [Candidatus Bathyarchaeia archaeon]|nr:ABC transporter permease [Candidatus Bathyarchaeia archaeon]
MPNIKSGKLWKLLTKNTQTKLGLIIVTGFLLVAVVEAIGGYGILRYNPTHIDVSQAYSSPSFTHPFGTTNLGQDIFSQIIAGAPNDALISFLVVAIACSFGSVVGATAGYSGGIIDDLLMRITDIFFAVPSIVLAVAISAILGPNIVNATIALVVIWWPAYARLARSEALRLKNEHFIESARLSGLSSRSIILRHILPVAASTILVYATLDIGTVIIVYSGLAYLGLVVRPPTPDWGAMVAWYQEFVLSSPWMPLIPAGIILIVASGFSMLGDGLRDALQLEIGR